MDITGDGKEELFIAHPNYTSEGGFIRIFKIIYPEN